MPSAALAPKKASISHLFTPRGPLAVARRVISKIVNSLNAQVWPRTVSHISDEIGELSPPFAHSNAATTVVRIGFLFLVVASVQHSAPHFILWSQAVESTRIAVRGIGHPLLAGTHSLLTATTGSHTLEQLVNGYSLFYPALTSTEPAQMGRTRFPSGTFNGGQFTEHLASEVKVSNLPPVRAFHGAEA
jgi:hypothetical protein